MSLLAWLCVAVAADAGSYRVTVVHGPDGERPVSVVPRRGRSRAPAAGGGVRSLILPGGQGVAAPVDRWFERRDLDVLPADLTLPSLRRRPAPPLAEAVSVSGPPEERLDLLFLAEGYTESQRARFEADVDAVVAHLRETEPYDRYLGLLNVWRVFAPSEREGIPKPAEGSFREPAADPANVYGCIYGCAGIERLICCDTEAVLAAAEGAVATHDGLMVLVNDPEYGGSGGMDYGASYNGDVGVEVAAHELGHSLVGLWDEYGYGYPGDASEAPNCANGSEDVPWAHWIGTGGVSAFTECSFSDAVRPTHDDCMMRTLQDGYCPVCREAVVKALYRQAPAELANFSPDPGALSLGEGDTVTLRADPAASFGVDWSITWKDAEGNVLGTGPSLDLGWCDAAGGSVRAIVEDPTRWVRVDDEGLLSAGATWTIDQDCPRRCGCGGQASAWPGLLAAALVWRRGRRR